GWTCLDVLDHTAKGTGVWAAFLEANPSEDPIELLTAEVRHALVWRAELADLVPAARVRFDSFLNTARSIDPSKPALFWNGLAPAGVMLCQSATESWVHVADVAAAIGVEVPISEDESADLLGWSVMFRMFAAAWRGDDHPSTLAIEATDTHQAFMLGSGEPAASVTGTAVELSMCLWGRMDTPPDGDLQALAAWADLAMISPLG
ncbi:MAG: maleylpyruvate isomerase family mycothiol-dependent enzyme, partial [Microthrixaceae bacterium]